MDSKYIEQLLEKYWACETSLEEEQQLKLFFAQSEVPAHLKEAAPLFLYFQEQSRKQLTDISFDHQVKGQMQQKPKAKSVAWIYNGARIAAGVAVVFVAIHFVRQEVRKSYPPEVVDTYSDPKLAFEETKKALMMISKGFGRAQKETTKLKLFNEAEEKVQGKDKKQEVTI
jgi:hypothetical protein